MVFRVQVTKDKPKEELIEKRERERDRSGLVAPRKRCRVWGRNETEGGGEGRESQLN